MAVRIKTTRLDQASASILYVGKAAVGALESAQVWRIVRITTTGAVTKIEYAGGNTEYSDAWTDRASLSYS